jgi:hypothetical protein
VTNPANNAAVVAAPENSGTNPLETDDSPAVILRDLERERGRLFSEREYRAIRESILDELARGPRPHLSTLLTFGTVGGLLFIFTAAGLWIVLRQLVSDYTLLISGICACGVWVFFFHGYWSSIRQNALRPLSKRLAELQDLRARNLITLEEYERIFASILLARQTCPPRAAK